MSRRRKEDPAPGAPAWFVTFADLMALLMSFFVILVAYSTADQRKLQVVAGSMRDTFGVEPVSRFSGIIEREGIPVDPAPAKVDEDPKEDERERSARLTRPSGLVNLERDFAFGQAAASLRQALSDLPDVEDLSRHILVEERRDSLEISLVDLDGRTMFPAGSAFPYERMRRALEAIAPVLARLPNAVAVSGHTATPRPGEIGEGEPWALSIGRALATRQILEGAGLPSRRFAAVTGVADTDPYHPDNAYLSANRRVRITILRE